MRLLRPKREDGEGAPQYLMRLALANGFASAESFAKDVGIDHWRIANGKDIGAFARSVSCDASSLERDTAAAFGREVRLLGQTVRRKQWSVSGRPQVCPACWREDLVERDNRNGLPRLWQRTWWDFRAASVCPIHLCELVSSCSCGAAMVRGRHLSGRCECGLAFADVAPRDLRREDCAGDLYIHRRLKGVPSDLPELDAFNLGDAVAVMHLCGRLNAVAEGMEEPASYAVLSAGHRIWRSWPDAFHRSLSDLAKRNMVEGRWGVGHAFGGFYEDFRRIEPATLRAKVHEAASGFARNEGITRGSKPAFGLKAANDDLMSLQAFANATGKGIVTARRNLEESGMIEAQVKRGFPARIPREWADKFEREKLAAVPASVLMRSLGIGKRVFGDLCDRGLLKPSTAHDGKGKRLFPYTEAERLRQDMERAASGSKAAIAADLEAVSKKLGVSVADLCAAVLDGRLRLSTYARAARLPQCVTIDLDEASCLFRRPKPGSITLQEAAKHLDVKWEVARSLRQAGLLGSKRSGPLRESDVAAFARSHVKNSTLAAALHTSPKKLLEIANANGILPEIGPPACRQAFFSVSEADRLRSLSAANSNHPSARQSAS